jgi:hypothetical protein
MADYDLQQIHTHVLLPPKIPFWTNRITLLILKKTILNKVWDSNENALTIYKKHMRVSPKVHYKGTPEMSTTKKSIIKMSKWKRNEIDERML